MVVRILLILLIALLGRDAGSANAAAAADITGGALLLMKVINGDGAEQTLTFV